MLDWTLQSGPAEHSPLLDQIYMSGVTFFTLGYGDIVPHSPLPAAVGVEAGLGLGFLAMVIGYLPVLYQLFSRREAHVIQLDVRAGTPPCACTLLSRHSEPGGLVKLDDLLREWEVWGSELLESHLSYPMLVYYRSQHDSQSWLSALAAVIDTCAVILVGRRRHPAAAGAHDLHHGPHGDRRDGPLLRRRAVALRRRRPPGRCRLRAPHRDHGRVRPALERRDDAQQTLAALRATYEPLLDALANRLVLRLPPWISDGDAPDNWQVGHRGVLATRLVEQLAVQADPQDAQTTGRLWRRMRARLDP